MRLSNRPHLHRAYEVTVCNQNFIAVGGRSHTKNPVEAYVQHSLLNNNNTKHMHIMKTEDGREYSREVKNIKEMVVCRASSGYACQLKFMENLEQVYKEEQNNKVTFAILLYYIHYRLAGKV